MLKKNASIFVILCLMCTCLYAFINDDKGVSTKPIFKVKLLTDNNTSDSIKARVCLLNLSDKKLYYILTKCNYWMGNIEFSPMMWDTYLDDCKKIEYIKVSILPYDSIVKNMSFFYSRAGGKIEAAKLHKLRIGFLWMEADSSQLRPNARPDQLYLLNETYIWSDTLTLK